MVNKPQAIDLRLWQESCEQLPFNLLARWSLRCLAKCKPICRPKRLRAGLFAINSNKSNFRKPERRVISRSIFNPPLQEDGSRPQKINTGLKCAQGEQKGNDESTWQNRLLTKDLYAVAIQAAQEQCQILNKQLRRSQVYQDT